MYSGIALLHIMIIVICLEPREYDDGSHGNGHALQPLCPIMLQKETSDGLADEECGQDVIEGMAGLCQYVLCDCITGTIHQSILLHTIFAIGII